MYLRQTLNMYNSEFYKNLIKSDLTPPSYVFPRVWMVLYFLMFASLLYIIPANDSKTKAIAIILFVLQFILNMLWSPAFFIYEKPKIALYICISLTLTVAFMLYFFFKISKFAALMNVPYFLWLLFANYLNFEVVRLNNL